MNLTYLGVRKDLVFGWALCLFNTVSSESDQSLFTLPQLFYSFILISIILLFTFITHSLNYSLITFYYGCDHLGSLGLMRWQLDSGWALNHLSFFLMSDASYSLSSQLGPHRGC